MTATLKLSSDGGKTTKNRKANHFYGGYKVLTIVDGEIKELIDLRFYATQAKHYACVWIKDSKGWGYGGGNAGGYGYHRESQATEEALADAGVTLSQGIGGVGTTAIEEALEAIVKDMGHNYVYISRFHA
jgi:hypothetical protein